MAEIDVSLVSALVRKAGLNLNPAEFERLASGLDGIRKRNRLNRCGIDWLDEPACLFAVVQPDD